jgi:hypothetical protein
MTFDAAAPTKLKKTQKWFASIITRQIDEDSRMSPISPSGELMEEEAWNYIKPSPTLRPAQRIEIYNQQYWWRLLGVLHDTFPLLTRLFGYHDFNQTIGFPYLLKYPPDSWSLSQLGEKISLWVTENYERSDKQLIYDAARVDWSYNRCFLASELAPLNMAQLPEGTDLSNVLEMTLYLRPSNALFALDYNFFDFRFEFLKQEPEYWVENDFPPLVKIPQWAILHRTNQKDLLWDEISETEFHLLSLFQNGHSIVQACAWLENQEGDHFKTASDNIHVWLQKWVVKQWLTLEKPVLC